MKLNNKVITDASGVRACWICKKQSENIMVATWMEWGVDERDGRIWILQARPETVWSRKEKNRSIWKPSTLDAGNRDIIVKGLPASPGNAGPGKAHVIINPEDIDEFKEGEILVTAMTAPD